MTLEASGQRDIRILQQRSSEKSVEIGHALERINGNRIQDHLLRLASFRNGGIIPLVTRQEGNLPINYRINRLALTSEDRGARERVIKPLMEDAGITEFHEHPLGLIGIYKPTSHEEVLEEPIVIFSHTDTIPNADLYDGTTGVVTAIEAVRAINDAHIKTKRPIIVVALTGEESSRFNMALFGSKGMFLGLTDQELDLTDSYGQSIREALGKHDEDVKIPIFGENGMFPKPHAVFEVHVDQDGSLGKKGLDIAVVEAIAAPERHTVKIGEMPLEPDTNEYYHTRYIELVVEGKADHSGATPMGDSNRADGLVATADILLPLLQRSGMYGTHMLLGNIAIEGQAMNKIPGNTKTIIRITGNSETEIDQTIVELQQRINQENTIYSEEKFPFDNNPISIKTLSPNQITEIVTSQFYDPEEMLGRQIAALQTVTAVNTGALMEAKNKTVGTVGTVKMDKGQIMLGVDVRGIDLASRNRTIAYIKEKLSQLHQVDFGNPLLGSGNPVTLDETLVHQTKATINRYLSDLNSAITYSPAGHDTQNVARAGIPATMIFIPSHDGIAHNPAAYTSTLDLQHGGQALVANVLELAA